MKIFVYTSNFLGIKPIIELIEYTFQYGSEKEDKPKILVAQSDPEFCKVPPVNDDPFIFIFAGISLDQVKLGLKILFERYSNHTLNILVIPANKEKDENYAPEFLYGDLGLKYGLDSFNESHFLFHNTVGFEQGLVKVLRNIIFKYGL